MYTKQEIIIRSHREGKSQRCISRELQINRKTVKKYIEEYENLRRRSSDVESASAEYLSKPPEYKGLKRSKLKLTSEVKSLINKLLSINEENRLKGMRKQIMKNIDIHAHLLSAGYDIGYTTVSTYIGSVKNPSVKPSEAFIRQEYQPGQSCEFDWGMIKIEIGGKLERIQMAVFTSAYSNYRYALLSRRQDTLAFQESHVSFIAHTGVVFQEMLYDNMRTAVSKFVGLHEKEPTQGLLQLRGHYQFRHRFCNFYRGNEKGHVERSVEYVRRKAFGLKNSFDTLEQAEEWLLTVTERLNGQVQQLTGKTADELFSQEKSVLAQAPARMRCAELIELKVDKYSTFSYKRNRYSVPDRLVGRYVDVQVTSQILEIYSEGQKIAEHPRHYGVHEWIVSIEHYLETFRRKPGALPGSVALASRALLKDLYEEYFQDCPREFIDLLGYCFHRRIGDEKLTEAVEVLRGSGLTEITTERLTALLGNQNGRITDNAGDTTAHLSRLQLEQHAALLTH